MRRRPVSAVVGLFAVASWTVLIPAPARAEPECQYFDPQKGICTIMVEKPAAPLPTRTSPMSGVRRLTLARTCRAGRTLPRTRGLIRSL
jgi:hypothetical protein